MDAKTVQRLADACGEIARGFKKLRSVLLKVETVPVSIPVLPEVPVAEPVKPPEKFAFQFYDPFDLLKTDAVGLWGAQFETTFYKIQVQRRLRGDRNGNQWVLSGENWIPVSYRYVSNVLLELRGIHDDIRGVLENDDCELQTILHPCRWKRRRFLVETELSEKTFRHFLIENHKEIGPMRRSRSLNAK